ncbi:MAG: hypothetical protein J6K22_00275 [Spirochaetaceae bacterium]|nr:hypothetical protein [Spirochaetaceae bacterium]
MKYMEITIEEVFEAYYECRKTKRYSSGALEFEVNLEQNLIELFNQLKNRTWTPGKSTCFMVEKPVRREIFAAPFRDRIVHHILIRRLNSTFEKYFIFDSYACRKCKGTHAAIKRVEHFLKSQTNNGNSKTYVLKLDIKGFFMNIPKSLLWQKLSDFIDKNYKSDTNDFEKYLSKEIIFNEPTKNCMIRSPFSEWNFLPKDKSLFTTKEGCGLPIGNLTSQVFANFFLSEYDHFIKHTLKVKCYVRYVDDCVFVHKDKEFLKYIIKQSRIFLQKKLQVNLHPKKIYLQNAFNGVEFLGTFIKPNYTVCSHRVKNNFVESLKFYSELANNHKLSEEEKQNCLASVNSYLGIMGHYKTFKFRKKQITLYFEKYIKKYFDINVNCKKIIKKT